MDHITNDDMVWLMQLLQSESLAEIEVGIGEDRIVLKAAAGSVPVAAPPPPAAPAPGAVPPTAATPQVPEGVETLRSPMAGIFYRRPSPDKPPFVEPGDEVQVGDTVGLIEAMKLFSEVTSHLHGRIVRFVPEDAQHVEADAPLVLIEPFHFRD
jgi:acetyl-CoA carboxylase biotin carboxyl carrier protein